MKYFVKFNGELIPCLIKPIELQCSNHCQNLLLYNPKLLLNKLCLAYNIKPTIKLDKIDNNKLNKYKLKIEIKELEINVITICDSKRAVWRKAAFRIHRQYTNSLLTIN